MRKSPSDSQKLKDIVMDIIDGTVCFDDVNTSWFAPGEVEVSVANAAVELDIFHFEAALIDASRMVAGTSAGEANLRIDIQQNGQFRTIAATNQIRDFLDEFQRNTAAIALVCHRGIVKTVADDNFVPHQ